MPDAAARSDLADHSEDYVLGRYVTRRRTFDIHAHPLRSHLRQSLCCQNMFDFARADAKCKCTERAMCCRVAVAANNCHARQRATLLWANYMHDALTRVAHRVERDLELFGVVAQHFDLFCRNRVSDR